MRIKLNGTNTEVQPGTVLMAVLRRFDIAENSTGVAVAVNEAVVPRREWTSRKIEDGDAVEIIRAVQGG